MRHYFTIIYAMMAASTFGVLLIIRAGGGKAQEISDLAGLNEQQPWLHLCSYCLLYP